MSTRREASPGQHQRRDDLPLYESVFIARPDISSAQVEALTEAIKTVIADNGGEVKKTEYWGLKNLAYRIKKNRKGHYGLLNLDAPAAAVSEMERTLRFNEDVLRFMTVRVDELEEEPSVMMRNKNVRDDRGGRDRDRGDRGDRGGRDGDRGGRDRDRGRDRDVRAEASPEEDSGSTTAASEGDES
jgi:small subunit ribosomal protein S6